MTAAVPPAAAADGTITIENRSAKAIKVVAPGGQVVIEADAEPATVAFTRDDDSRVGVDVKAWWVDEPRQLCQLFTPWERTVVVTGSTLIRCRSR